MANFTDNPDRKTPSDEANWARPGSKLKVTDVPAGATNINVDGNLVASPLQGFGKLWQKTFTLRLKGIQKSPAEVMQIWKDNFPKLQPSFNRFYPSPIGVAPGELMFIDSSVPVVPGRRGVLPITTGVMVLYSDELTFTVITPEGHPESGWNTFSVFEEDGEVIAQIKSLTRATDPIYEFGFYFMGGSRMQDQTWMHVLSSLGQLVGIQDEVAVSKTCLDPHMQWSETRNLWKNAVIRTTLYKLVTPVRWVRNRFRARI